MLFEGIWCGNNVVMTLQWQQSMIHLVFCLFLTVFKQCFCHFVVQKSALNLSLFVSHESDYSEPVERGQTIRDCLLALKSLNRWSPTKITKISMNLD